MAFMPTQTLADPANSVHVDGAWKNRGLKLKKFIVISIVYIPTRPQHATW